MSLESAAANLAELQETGQATLDRAMRLQAEVSKLEKDVLEAQRDHARKKEEEAKQERRMIEAQLDIIKARNEIRSS